MQNIKIQQLDRKMSSFVSLKKVKIPATGWIKATRMALGMSLQQMANRLMITRQSVRDIEIREQEGTITLKSLREAAAAMDMHLVYGFVPLDGSLDALIDRKAKELATRIVLRTDQTMRLEDQENSKRRLKKAIAERASVIKSKMPRMLWD